MAGSSTVYEDDSLLSRLDRALVPLERFMALISGLAVFSLMCLAVYSVTGRKFFNAPLAGYVDYIEAAMPLIAFMGISYVQRNGGHIRMDIVVGALRGRALWFFELITTALVLLLIVGILVVSGMFLEGAANILLVTPIVMPVLVSVGYDPIHMGILMVLLINFGGLTPPVGVIMFTVCGILGVKTGAYTRASAPFFLALALFFCLLAMVPALSTWLPRALM